MLASHPRHEASLSLCDPCFGMLGQHCSQEREIDPLSPPAPTLQQTPHCWSPASLSCCVREPIVGAVDVANGTRRGAGLMAEQASLLTAPSSRSVLPLVAVFLGPGDVSSLAISVCRCGRLRALAATAR